jgi:hybrid cluster-associated redox disulfide protein
MAKVTKDMIIADVLRMDRETAPIFMRHGLHCLGCPASSMESIADAAMVHGLNVDSLINDLNEYLASKGE